MCESDTTADVRIGPAAARMLRNRLADLRSASTPKDLVAGNPRIAQDGNEMQIELCDGWRLVLEANHVTNPLSEQKRVDWDRVSRVKVVRIEQ